MRLTSFTDYTLRMLLHLAADEQRLVTIHDMADLHGISKNHLMKVVYELGRAGIVETVRGRNGGFRLRRRPEEINVGAVVRLAEGDFHMAECFDPAGGRCCFSSGCGLQHVLAQATDAYLAELDRHTLAALLRMPQHTSPVHVMRRLSMPDGAQSNKPLFNEAIE